MQRVLLLGANGFLGRHVCAALRARPELTVRTASRSGATDLHLDLARVQADAFGALLRVERIDVVVNCAGAVSGDSAELAAANITGPATLVTALARQRPQARLVHLGSAAEYGATEVGVPITESVAGAPVGGYGLSKLAGTELIRLGRQAGLDTVVLRVFNPIGAHAPAGSLPGRLAGELRRALAEDDGIRLGPLDAARDFVDARDIAEAVLAACTAPLLVRPVLNVAGGAAVAVRTVVDMLSSLAGFTGTVHCETSGSPRSAEVPWQCADISAISTELGWKPRIGLAESIAELWRSTR